MAAKKRKRCANCNKLTARTKSYKGRDLCIPCESIAAQKDTDEAEKRAKERGPFRLNRQQRQ